MDYCSSSMIGSHETKSQELAVCMQLPGPSDPPSFYVRLVKACMDSKNLTKGLEVHARIRQSAHRQDRLLLNLLIEMYGKCGSLGEARDVFDNIEKRNVFSWNIMITAYAQNGYLREARGLFDRMPERDSVSWNSIVTAYAQDGDLEEAWWLFRQMPQRNTVSWNSMIAAYAQHGHCRRAITLFKLMDLEGVQPDEFTFLSVLDACSSTMALTEGKHVHESITEMRFLSVLLLGGALINMYGKCGQVDKARSIFLGMPQRNMISWTAMISAYAQNSQCKESIQLFKCMDLEGVQSNKVTFVTVLDACGSSSALEEGRIVHASIASSDYGSETDVVLGTALIDMYGKCGSPKEARCIFDKMLYQNIVTWTAMLASYARNGQGTEGIALFRRMDLEGVRPNNVTFVSILDACASNSAIGIGRIIHADIAADASLESDVVVGTAIVSMYAKCGSLDDARHMFDKMPKRNEVSWNAMIAGYAHNGHGSEALEISHVMDLEGMPKKDITFGIILAACSRSGLLEEAWKYFVSMRGDYAITPTMDHYVCMVDILARGGRLAEAETLVNNMPFEPGALAWSTLLGACRMHANLDQATRAAENASELDADTTAPYLLLLSSICAAA